MNFLTPILRRIRLVCRLAVLIRSNSDGNAQIIQVRTGANETLTDLLHREPYGYTSRAKSGAEAVVVALGGNPSHSIVILVGDRRYRLTGLAEGEVAIYDDLDQTLILRRTHIELNAPQGFIVNGNTTINGNTAFNGEVRANGKRIDETHTHTDVQSGTSQTGTVA